MDSYFSIVKPKVEIVVSHDGNDRTPDNAVILFNLSQTVPLLQPLFCNI